MGKNRLEPWPLCCGTEGNTKGRRFLLSLASNDTFWKVLPGPSRALNRGGAPAHLYTAGGSWQTTASRGRSARRQRAAQDSGTYPYPWKTTF